MSVDGSALLNGRRPLWLVALLALLLVLMAIASDPVLNRDGMYYVDTARTMLQSNAMADHEWLFFPAMLSAVAGLLSVDPLWVAQAYSVITSVLLAMCLFVWLSQAGMASSPKMAMVAALTVPWLLEYQSYVIRDSAAWLALLATLVLARSWVLTHQWRWLALMPIAALAGFLFRTEMLLLLVVPGWLALLAGWRRGWKTVAVVLAAVLLVAALALPLAWEFVSGHVRFYLDAVNNNSSLMLFPEFAASLEPHVNPYVRSDLATVLMAGLLLLPVIGVAGLLGIYLFPLVLGVHRHGSAVLRRDDGASAVLLVVFLAVVLSFLFVMQFVVGRYLVPMAICLMPWVYQGLLRMERGFPRTSKAFVAVAIITALAASISSGGGKGYLKEAGQYVDQNRALLGPVYYTDSRIAFYAGDRYQPKQQRPLPMANPEALAAAHSLVLTVRKDGTAVTRVLEKVSLEYGFSTVVFQADNGDDKGVFILSR